MMQQGCLMKCFAFRWGGGFFVCCSIFEVGPNNLLQISGVFTLGLIF